MDTLILFFIQCSRIQQALSLGYILAGGNWDDYLKCLIEYSNKSNIYVFIIKKE